MGVDVDVEVVFNAFEVSNMVPVAVGDENGG